MPEPITPKESETEKPPPKGEPKSPALKCPSCSGDLREITKGLHLCMGCKPGPTVVDEKGDVHPWEKAFVARSDFDALSGRVSGLEAVKGDLEKMRPALEGILKRIAPFASLGAALSGKARLPGPAGQKGGK